MIAVAGITVAVVFAAFPIAVDASLWPFTKTRAAEPVAVHDSSLKLLEAAANIDPNPSKGGLDIATTEGLALVPNGGPVGLLSSASFSAEADDVSTYLVREGDALSEIADMFGVSQDTILLANGLKSASAIRPGDTLKILPVSGVEHKVGKGETLAGIAKKYGVDVDEVASANGLDEDDALAAGDTLLVPGGEAAAKKSSAKKAVAKSSGSSAKPLPALSGYFANPVAGGRITQGIHGKNGIDVGAPAGTAVYAAAAGTVTAAYSDGLYHGGYGNYVDVSHPNGTKTRYAHLSSVSVSVGDSVSQGDLLGGVGNTGKSTGNHLHFEVHGAANPLAH